jgi:hypothetical protein
MQNHEQREKSENLESMAKQHSFLAPYTSALEQFQPHGCM